MTHDERRRIGLALKALRVGKELDQIAVARRVKLSVGTVQAIEGNWYEVKDSNIERVAKFFGTSLRKLLEPTDAVSQSDPLLERLTREDLLIARAYHDATTVLRQRVHGLLHDGEPERISTLLHDLRQFSSDDLDVIEASITALKLAQESHQIKTQRKP